VSAARWSETNNHAPVKSRRAVSRSKPPHTHHADDILPKLWWIAYGESTLQR